MELFLPELAAFLFSHEDYTVYFLIGSIEMVADYGFLLWQDNENFVEDGIQIEPFNLDKEREEGYFDADGNFVEYVNDKEIKVNFWFVQSFRCRIELVY